MEKHCPGRLWLFFRVFCKIFCWLQFLGVSPIYWVSFPVILCEFKAGEHTEKAELKLNFVGDSGLRLRYEWMVYDIVRIPANNRKIISTQRCLRKDMLGLISGRRLLFQHFPFLIFVLKKKQANFHQVLLGWALVFSKYLPTFPLRIYSM